MTPVHCPHADRCAGCPRIDEPYDTQLQAKQGRVEASLRRFAEPHVVAPCHPAPFITGYRTRVKLVVAPGPRIGLYAKKGDHVVVDIPECQVMAPVLSETLRSLRRLLQSAG